MFGIGPGELVVIIIVALVVLGPEKLPSVARTLGRISGELRRLSTEFQRTLNTEIDPNVDEDRSRQNHRAEAGTAPGSDPETETATSDQPRSNELAEAQNYIDVSSNTVPESVAKAEAEAEASPGSLAAAKHATGLERI